jgi:hypothetical protein
VASSSGTRWVLACDACAVEFRVGRAPGGYDVWCEACQSPDTLPSAPLGQRCPRCGAPYAASPRFIELWGELQHLDAVLGAWAGDITPLATILPERPRFVTDLTPPAPRADDPPARAEMLTALAHGAWPTVLAFAPDVDPRALAARAIAHERTGDPGSALEEWGRVLEAGEDPRARLARGALLARAGRLEEAVADLERAGDGVEARWDRAAAIVERVVATGGTPDPAALRAARDEAGPPSAYWSDPTVGRLLWTLLVGHEHAARGSVASPGPDAVARLRAAEAEFEHATFWDRAMVLLGWARLDAVDEVARVAAPLARELAAELLDEPALRGAPLHEVSEAVTAARAAMDTGRPVEARHTIAPAFAREDLRRFRMPCAACGRGTIGLEAEEGIAGEA